MLIRKRLHLFAIHIFMALVVAGCGGSDDSFSSSAAPSSLPEPSPASTAVVISGVAASGAPLVNARVNIMDQRGVSIGSGQTADDGSFSVDIDPSFKPPMVLTATGAADTLVSTVDTQTSATVNINPVSTLVAALMSATGDPSRLASELASGRVTLDEKSIIANWSKVDSILKPLLTALKTDINNLRSGIAPANGTGPDLLLDTLEVAITKSWNDFSTIEISIKSAAEDQEMPVIRFTNSMPLEKILTANGITATTIQNRPIQAANLPDPGTSVQIADLLKRMTACFSLPLETRVNSGAGTVTAPQCRSLFRNDDPATYLHSGAAVGPAGAFPGLFAESGTGAGFGQGTFEYKLNNGDVAFSFVSVDKNLTSRREESVATPGRDGKLRLAGNQYKFAGSVHPLSETRTYMDSRLSSLISIGYEIRIPLQKHDGEDIARVEVTSPRGAKYSLVRGTSSMTLPKLDSNFAPELNDDGTIASSGSAFVRLRVMTAEDFVFNTRGSVNKLPYPGERGLQLPRQTETDDIIASYPPRGIWRLEYFKAGSASPVARQLVRTRARALTISELGASNSNPFYIYHLTNESLAPLWERINPASTGSGLYVPLKDLPSTSYAWYNIATPPFTPLVPVSIRVVGTLLTPVSIPPIQDFVDEVSLSSDMLQATVPCGVNNAVPHCDGQGRYLENTWLESIQLFSRDSYGREFLSTKSTWRAEP